MNDHLRVIFETLLPDLGKAQINYWVFGGVSIAAYAGRFTRNNNKDVDIFVEDQDFENAKLILEESCRKNNFELASTFSKSRRPKVEIKISNIERFSMIPIYQKDNMVIFKYDDGDQKYPNQILERIERNISGYRFFTPPDELIKKMFINHIKARPDKKNRDKIKKDAIAILSSEDFSSLNWCID